MRATLAIGSSASRIASCRGFTLLELLVVLAILVLTGVAFPFALNRVLPGRRVVVVAERLTTALREAEAESVVSGMPARIEVDGHDVRLTIVGLNDRDIRSRRVASVPFKTRVEVTDSDGRSGLRVLLYPDGSTSGARFRVSEGPHERFVEVGALTGRITIEPGA